MIFYRVLHNLTKHTQDLLINEYGVDVDYYGRVFTTKKEATEYANKIKKNLTDLCRSKKEEYKNSDGADFLKENAPTKYISGCGFGISINKMELKTKEEIAKELCGVKLQEFFDTNDDCDPYDHYDCAVFYWDHTENNSNAPHQIYSEETFQD